jgi:GNAT superfamily N-acetyltransferase
MQIWGAGMDNINIKEIDLNKTEITDLINESLSEGHRHIYRLLEDYKNGTNRFDEEGEALFAAYLKDRIIGICGLNKDPYLNDRSIGRVRRLYVLKAYRQHGVGRRLMDTVIQEARRHYTVIVLNTDNPVADKFYRSLGFSVHLTFSNSTHHFKLKNDPLLMS